ncbi:MAG: hypothetical protein M1405_00665 [Patescibacteria group bacterium]|nr:hypothetical protein [Patescibacteria group bacterium]
MKLKVVLITFFTVLLFFFYSHTSFAIYDPTSKPNNIVGIHILFPDELSEAAKLVNSKGGDWGYITIPIQASDKNLVKWQKFMDDSRKNHLIPILRLATDGDYFNTVSWSKPTDSDVLDFANFLNSLNWPTKNRYVVIYNEPNRGDEWGGVPNPAEYAEILSYATDVFKQRSDEFFIISAGLDNASVNIPGQSVNEYTFIRRMEEAVPGVFAKIDGMASHSYPNPGFSQYPSSYRYEGTASFKYERDLIQSLEGKSLPVFVTETGWTNDKISDSVQSDYYKTAFTSIWNDDAVIAVTPFLLRAGLGPFAQFSFIKDGSELDKYNAIQNLQKSKGEPILNEYPLAQAASPTEKNLPLDTFTQNIKQNYTTTVSKATRVFMKWLLNF